MKKLFSFLLVAILAIATVGCSQKKESKVIDLNQLKTSITETYGEDYTAQDINLTLFGDMYASIEDLYKDRYGLTSDMYEEVIAQMSIISAQSDEFVAVHAKEGQVAEVVKVFLQVA